MIRSGAASSAVARHDRANGGLAGSQYDDWSYRSAICAFVVAEARQGVHLHHLAAMRFGGRPAAEEVEHVAATIDQLQQEGLLVLRDGKVSPGIGGQAG